MVLHTLKRVYLSTAVTFALLFTAYFTVNLLTILLNAAGLVREYSFYDDTTITVHKDSLPTDQQVIEAVVFFAIALVIGGLAFGGSHYWLIRRDERDDPQASSGATRHIFLNGLLAASMLVAVIAGLVALGQVGHFNYSADIAPPLSWALVAAAVFALVMLERWRVKLTSRAAVLLRRAQEIAMQGVLLAFVGIMLDLALAALVRWPLWDARLLASNYCESGYYGPAVFDQPSCAPAVLGPVLQAVFALAAWGLYVWLGRGYWGSVWQRVLWYAALGAGITVFLFGVLQGVALGLGEWLGVPNAWNTALIGGLSFISTLLTGVLIALPYFFWLRRLAAQSPTLRFAIPQGMLALLTAISAVFFLVGAVFSLGSLVETLVPNGLFVQPGVWASQLGVLIAGAAYLPLAVVFQRLSDLKRGGPIIPRRAYVLALLLLTGISAIIAVVVLVYQSIALPLGLSGASGVVWRGSLVALVVLGILAFYHLFLLLSDLRVLRERAATEAKVAQEQAGTAPATVPEAAPAETASTPTSTGKETLEDILGWVAAGALDPTTAAARIRSLPTL